MNEDVLKDSIRSVASRRQTRHFGGTGKVMLFFDIQISMFFLKLLKNYFHPKWMVSQLKLFRVSVSFVWKISWENLTRQKLQKHLNSVCCPQQDL